MTSPYSPAPPEQELPSWQLAYPREIVWGAPSDEMLASEAHGEIILVEDIQRQASPSTSGSRPTSHA
jgi:hypothetical protein